MNPSETPNTYFDLFLGYSVIWGLIALYLIGLVRDHRKISKRLDALESSAREPK